MMDEHQQVGETSAPEAKAGRLNYWIVAGCLIVLAAVAYAASLYVGGKPSSNEETAAVDEGAAAVPVIAGDRNKLPLVYTFSLEDAKPNVGSVAEFKIYDPNQKKLVENRKLQLQEFVNQSGITSSTGANNPVYYSPKANSIFYLNEPYQDCDGLGCKEGRLPAAVRIMKYDLAAKSDTVFFEELSKPLVNENYTAPSKMFSNLMMTPDERYLLAVETTFVDTGGYQGIQMDKLNILKFDTANGVVTKLTTIPVPSGDEQMMFGFRGRMDISADSKFVLMGSKTANGLEAVKINIASGNVTRTPVPDSTGGDGENLLSSSGDWVAFWDEGQRIATYNLENRKDVRQALSEPIGNVNIVWSENGDQLLFNGNYWLMAGSNTLMKLGLNKNAYPLVYDSRLQIAFVANGAFLPENTRKFVLWDVANDTLLDDQIGKLIPIEHEASTYGFGFIR